MPTDKQQLETKISNMEKELAEMKKILATPEPISTYWTPEHGDTYWYINQSRGVNSAINEGISYERYRVFKTEAEAKKYADYIKAEETLKKAIADLNQGWWPDFSKNIPKFCITPRISLGTFTVNYEQTMKEQPSFMYLKSAEVARLLIKQYKPELITYYSY